MASPVVDAPAGDRLPAWTKIQEEWRKREFGALRERARLEGVAVEHVHDLLFPDKPELAKDPRVVLGEAFDAADTESRQALLALYVYGLCLKKWETSESYEDIDDVLDALDKITEHRSELVRLIARQAQHVKHGIEVEQAMNCSCPVMMADRAGQIVGDLSTLLQDEGKLDGGPDFDGLRDVVRSDAVTSSKYFGAIQEIADTVRDFVLEDAADAETSSKYFGAIEKIADTLRDFVLADAADFAGVLAELEESERALEDDVYGSELRPHRASLGALADRAAEPRLLVRAAELAYVYPFALEDIDETTIEEPETIGVVLAKLTAAGIGPLGTGELELNDIWVGTPAYSGASIELPPIEVTTTARAVDEKYPPLESFEPELRLSRLGNHHLVVRSSLEDAGFHELNQALRRGCDGMGAESLTWKGQSDSCEKFTDYAALVIEAITNEPGDESAERIKPTFHVVLAARSISVQGSDRARPLTSERLEKAARNGSARDDDEFQPILGASLLFHPVRHLTTSLHEWVRYPRPTAANLLEGQAYAGDLVIRTDNTTVAYMPDSPEWLIDEYEEMIEFVASLPPLLSLWQKQAEGENAELDRWLPDIEKKIESGEDPIDDLQKQEQKIHRLESKIRRELGRLHSPALVKTRAQRHFLDELWKAAGLPALESELERELTLLAERQQRIATLVSSIDQRVRRNLERPLTIVLGLLAVASLAEVLSWINQAFELEGRRWAVREAWALVAVAALLAGLYLWVYYRRKLMGPVRWLMRVVRPRKEPSR